MTSLKGTFFFIPHTHWEGAVFKTREQYLEMGLPTILRALKLLKQYPSYRFTLDQACYVKPFLERYPEEEEAFVQFVREGRLAIIGGLDVMPDVNMPCGESFVRQIIYGKGYFRRKLGLEVTTGWQLDTFGHHAQIPQLMKLAGYKTFWAARGVESMNLPSEFWWEGLDGTRIPFYWMPLGYACTYGSPASPDGFALFMKERYDALAPYTKGADRNGPAGADVCLPEEHVPVLVQEFNRQSDAPFSIRISVPSDYETSAESRSAERPVVHGERNPIFQGTYSSRIEVKQRTRELERLLTTAEALGAILSSMGETTDREKLWSAWEPMLFNHAHDLMSGVMTDQVWYDSIRGYDFSLRIAEEEVNSRLKLLTDSIDTRGEGIAVVVFNALSWQTTDVVFADAGFIDTDVGDLEMTGPDGKPVPVQIIKEERAGDGSLVAVKIAFIARDVPGLGYAVYHIVPRKAGKQENSADAGTSPNVVLENALLRVEISRATGAITAIFDKQGKRDVLNGPGNVVAREEDHGDLWEPYRTLNGGQLVMMKERHPAPKTDDSTVFSTDQSGTDGVKITGAIFSEFSVSHPFGEQGVFATRIRLYADIARVEVRTRILNNDRFVRYRALFPVAVRNGQSAHAIPFGAVNRPEGIEFPAQEWIDYSDEKNGVALLNRGLPGNNVADGIMMVSLMRSSVIGGYGYGGGYEPGMSSDTGLELGKELSFDYALVPHSGDWRNAGIHHEGLAFNRPLIAVTASCHEGRLPDHWGFVVISTSDVLVSSLKPAEDGGGIVLRMYEATGKTAKGVRVSLSADIESGEEVNLMEDTVRALELRDNSLQFDFRPFEIKTVKLRLRESRI